MKSSLLSIFTIAFAITLSIAACSWGSKPAKLTEPIDDSEVYWYPCTPKMRADYKGKYCLVKCKEGLKEDGTCKKGKYHYPAKDCKTDHDFFMNRFILIPQHKVF